MNYCNYYHKKSIHMYVHFFCGGRGEAGGGARGGLVLERSFDVEVVSNMQTRGC